MVNCQIKHVILNSQLLVKDKYVGCHLYLPSFDRLLLYPVRGCQNVSYYRYMRERCIGTATRSIAAVIWHQQILLLKNIRGWNPPLPWATEGKDVIADVCICITVI